MANNITSLKDGTYENLSLYPKVVEAEELADLKDSDLIQHWHEGQQADLSKNLSVKEVQRFFDIISRKAFLPWLRALTGRMNDGYKKLNALNKTTIPDIDGRLETLEVETVPGIDNRLLDVEVEVVPRIDRRLQTLEEETVPDLEKRARILEEAFPTVEENVGVLLRERVFITTREVVNGEPVPWDNINTVMELANRDQRQGLDWETNGKWYHVIDVVGGRIFYTSAKRLMAHMNGEKLDPIASFVLSGDIAPKIEEALADAKANGDFKGDPGLPGKDGQDYILTDADKQEMVDSVLAALPNGDEVSY